MAPVSLTPLEQDALRELVEAGKAGVLLGRDFALSLAVRLEAAGFAWIHEGRFFTAIATAAGKSFIQRDAQ